MAGVGEDKPGFIVRSTLLPLSASAFRGREYQSGRSFFCRFAGRKNRLVITPERTVLESGGMAIPALGGVALEVECPSAMFSMTGETIVLVLGAYLYNIRMTIGGGAGGVDGLTAPGRVTGGALSLPLGMASSEGATRKERRVSPDQKTSTPNGGEEEGHKNGLPT